jgi:fidgetin-like protein 1
MEPSMLENALLEAHGQLRHAYQQGDILKITRSQQDIYAALQTLSHMSEADQEQDLQSIAAMELWLLEQMQADLYCSKNLDDSGRVLRDAYFGRLEDWQQTSASSLELQQATKQSFLATFNRLDASINECSSKGNGHHQTEETLEGSQSKRICLDPTAVPSSNHSVAHPSSPVSNSSRHNLPPQSKIVAPQNKHHPKSQHQYEHSCRPQDVHDHVPQERQGEESEDGSNKRENPFVSARQQWETNELKQGRSVPPRRHDPGNPPAHGKSKSSSHSSATTSTLTRKATNSSGGEDAAGSAPGSSLPPELAESEFVRGVDPELLERIMHEVVDRSPSTGWDDVVGLSFAKQSVQEAVIWPLRRPDLFSGLRGPAKGLLLFGPPGTGKTMIGRALSAEAGATFFAISASSLTSKWIGESEKMVRALFGCARALQPSIVFIDEIDSLLTSRSDGEMEATRRLKTEFLVQLDGASVDASKNAVIVIGATNRPAELDDAARRRLVKRLLIPLPEDLARLGMIQRLLRDQMHVLSEEDLQHIVRATEGYSGADMHALCTEAALGPIRQLTSMGVTSSSQLMGLDASAVPAVALEHFQSALKQVRASVSQADLEGYRVWNEKFGSFG